ncbi:hypothetical protein E8E12_002267 [Didymella heteroderae]|uniref:Uncharacterized protein n=1 Tax=Didymella heteroderae TaxID=1769908 RepID=A0A9P5BXZ5_9PLEO|nr:hypothetical protein E8E12_002267 [Didymella heteroderae]
MNDGRVWEMDCYPSGENSSGDYTTFPAGNADSSYQRGSNAPSLNDDLSSRIRTENSIASLTSRHDFHGNEHQPDTVLSAYGAPARRFYLRTAVGVFGPLIILIYVLVIWRTYLSPTVSKSSTAFGPTGAKWVFYSWFIAGVVGLGLSRYGLAGAEVGMIAHPRWKVKDKMQLMLHADGTWTGLSGWAKTGKWMVQMRRAESRHTPGRLWAVLALPSFVVLAAWLFSCLCIEMATGFHHGVREPTEVMGFVYEDFNANPGGRKPSRGSFPSAQIPRFGAIYTPESFDRSTVEFLQTVPVILPDSEGVEEIFITAQSEAPIEGKAWGLLVHYDCKVVEKQTDLRLLNDRKLAVDIWERGSSVEPDPIPAEVSISVEKRQDLPVIFTPSPIVRPTRTVFSKIPESTSRTEIIPPTGNSPLAGSTSLTESTSLPAFPSPGPDDDIPPAYHYGTQFNISYRSYPLHDNATLVEVRKEPRAQWNGAINVGGEAGALNMDAVIETAYESWPFPNGPGSENPCHMPSDSSDNPATSYCYYNADTTADSYPGIDRKRLFEVLLWQGIQIQEGWGNSQFNASLYNLTIDHNITELYGEYTGLNSGANADEDPDSEKQGEGLTAIGVSCTSSSSVGTADIDGVRSTYSNFVRTDSPIPARKGDCARRFGAETLACTLDLNSTGALQWLFDSIGAPPPLDMSDPNNLLGNGDWRENAQLTYLQASQLRQSLLQAFSNYAIRLMYNDGRDFIAADGSRVRTSNPNVTAFAAGRVITPGVMPPGIPVALFAFWALITSSLCLLYGTRRRWSAVLDTATVLKLGAELEIPGFGGEVDRSEASGRVGLRTNANVVGKGKF